MTTELSIIIGLIASLAFLFWEYIKLHRSQQNNLKARHQSSDTIHKKTLQVLDEAREEANKILRNARTQASAHQEKISTKIDTVLNLVAQREINDFKKALEIETINIEKTVGEKITTRYEEVRKEIEEYKAKQITTSDQKINKVLAEIIQKLLSKTINADEHQKLVVDALEEAKQNGLFN
jgi:F0F1-type ATP synthase membrane subunit b/b'